MLKVYVDLLNYNFASKYTFYLQCNFTMTSPPESSPTDNTVTNIEFEIVCTSTPKKKDSECPRDEVAIMTDAANSSSNEVLSLNQGQAKK